MKKVLISGGAGFIGSNIAFKLYNKGYQVTILDNLSPQIHGKNAIFSSELKEKANCILGDVRKVEDWRKAIKNQDIVIHLAAETGTGQSMYEIYKYSDTNIGGTAHMLDVLTNEEHQIKKVIIASSRAIYGEGMYYCEEHGLVFPVERNEEDMNKGDFETKCPICSGSLEIVATGENTKIQPTSIYGITKQVQEQMIMVICKALGINALAYRFQNVYGPGQSLNNPYTGILSIFSTRILNGKSINIFEDGKESRDFVYIDDVANAVIAGIENDEVKYECFNVGSGIMTSVNQVVDALQQAYGKQVEVTISGNYRVGDIRHNYADIDKMLKLLKYEPKIDFATGIRNFADWVKAQKINDDQYENSLKEMKNRGLFK